jgi:trimethylamine--corrinoid protein Co-methyltransferase
MELMVACDEIIDMVKRILRGIPVNDETMALDVMETIGPGGHYLEHDHTYDRFKTEIWRPKLVNRQRLNDWTTTGSKRHSDRVHEKVIEILETETEPLMEDAMVKELRRICELADSRHKDEELDIKFV